MSHIFPEISGYSSVTCRGQTQSRGQTQKPRDFGDTSMWGDSVCSCLNNLTSAIIYYHILSKTNNVANGDFHRSSAPWVIFQCTLSKLKHFSQSCLCRTFRNIITLCPNPTFVDFISVFSFFCEDFDDRPTNGFCNVHDFTEVDLFFKVPCSAERLHRPVLSRI